MSFATNGRPSDDELAEMRDLLGEELGEEVGSEPEDLPRLLFGDPHVGHELHLVFEHEVDEEAVAQAFGETVVEDALRNAHLPSRPRVREVTAGPAAL